MLISGDDRVRGNISSVTTRSRCNNKPTQCTVTPGRMAARAPTQKTLSINIPTGARDLGINVSYRCWWRPILAFSHIQHRNDIVTFAPTW